MITMVSTCCLNQFREMSIFWGKVINLTFLDFYFLYKGSFQKLPTYFRTLYFLPNYTLLAQPACVCHLVAFAQSEEDFFWTNPCPWSINTYFSPLSPCFAFHPLRGSEISYRDMSKPRGWSITCNIALCTTLHYVQHCIM